MFIVEAELKDLDEEARADEIVWKVFKTYRTASKISQRRLDKTTKIHCC